MEKASFVVAISEETLADLRERLARTRWPNEVANTHWEYGTNLAYLKELVAYWRDGYDWRRQEQTINAFSHYRVTIDGVPLHFMHQPGRGPKPLPLILTHGWPCTFWDLHKVIRPLSDPAAFGGDTQDAFDVVVPSLPGYGFSDKPAQDGTLFKVAGMWATLMTKVLGYRRFGAHGGDWGSTVTEHLARSHADAVVGIHITDVPFLHLFEQPKDLSARE